MNTTDSTEENKNMRSRVRESADVRFALRDVLETTSGRVRLKDSKEVPVYQKIILVFSLGLLLLMGFAHYAFHLDQLPIEEKYIPVFPRLIIGAMLVLLVFILSRFIKVFYVHRIEEVAIQHNMRQVVNICSSVILFFIIISVLFVNWYAAVVSLGLLSLILGFALQVPIMSFIGWIYIVSRKPYKLGDRIKVGDAAGDVIDIDYMDTTLWEIKGDLSTSHFTGRILRFPNANLLSSMVTNYSWALYPYMYDEIKFYLRYGTDLKEIGELIKMITDHILGTEELQKIGIYRELLKEANVDTNQMNDTSEVIFKPGEASIETIVIYPVLPSKAAELNLKIAHEIFEAIDKRYKNTLYPEGS